MASLVRGIRVAVARFSRTRFFRRVGPTIMPPLERAIRFLTRGRVQLSGLLVPSLVLRTTGAKSGLARETELMYVPEPDGRMLVTGSNFAGAAHPAWSANLIAHPDAEVVVHGRPVPVRAHLVDDDEREAVWAFIEQQWPGYRGYERASGRTLRIFRLDPRTGAGGGYA
ncbi:nitroreductase family deazaflavin-dependent oxidoreductase [Herbiconiux solani]|uniref:nitroreductase family deazaflavin-dependent oxidoreductase n=1 Tax=Herbiconiux solani TaxID=661329 RepID=UPI00082675EA|nr:nitroreductase family deazaflavin-dependent oxidoreductase [Herbiconiux solani]